MLVLSVAFGSNAQQGAKESLAFHGETGMLRFVGADGGFLPAPSAIAGQSFAQTSAFWVNNYAAQFGVGGSQMVAQSINDLGSRASVRYQQAFNGVPVFAGQMVVNVTANGDLIGMQGEVSPALTMSTTPQISATDAANAAIAGVSARLNVAANSLSVYANALNIYDARLIGSAGNTVALAYVVEVTNGGNIDAIAFVDANTSVVHLLFNRVDTQWDFTGAQHVGHASGAKNQAKALMVDVMTYDAENVAVDLDITSGTLLCSETSDVVGEDSCTSGVDADADGAHYDAAGVANFLYELHGRNSLDDAGMPLVSTVHYDTGYCNAFWNGSQMTYGDGCPDGSLVYDDVVGHEFIHGLTDFTSNLLYWDQSGAINESMSDVWGELYDQLDGHEGPADGTDYTWRLAEETAIGYTDSEGNPLYGLRDMRDPNIFGDPGAMNDGYYYYRSGDNYGVHYNSGINNKAVYLMVDGDEFNGINVNGIGAEKVLKIYYDVQTNWLTNGANYKDLSNALAMACNALLNDGVVTANDCIQVNKAAAAVQMHQDFVIPAGPTAEVCPAGHSVYNVAFTEDFSSALDPDTFWFAWEAFVITDDPGDVYFAAAPQVRMFTNGNVYAHLPDNAVGAGAFLHRTEHYVPNPYSFMYFESEGRFEYAGGGDGWDGGHVTALVSLPAGVVNNANVLQSNFASNTRSDGDLYLLEPIDGLQYHGINISAGAPGFTTAWGPSSSLVPLGDLAGYNVSVGFTSFSDFILGEAGMTIDNIAVYTCMPDTLAGGDFENGTDDWKVRGAGFGDKVKCNKADKGKLFSYSGECAYQFVKAPGETGKTKLFQVQNAPDVNDGDVLEFDAQVASRGGNKVGAFRVKVVYAGPDYATNPLDKVREKVVINFNDLDLTAGYSNINAFVDITGVPLKIRTDVVFNNNASSGKLMIDDFHHWAWKDEVWAPLGGMPATADAPRRVTDTRGTLPVPDAPSGFRD